MKGTRAQAGDEDLPGAIYSAEIVVHRDGTEVRLPVPVRAGSLRQLVKELGDRAPQLEAEVAGELERAASEKSAQQDAEHSGRRHRAWE